jgi:UDP-3-O-[3-hydroxymyristoyl] glucosamine N-acyltransferase
MPPGQIWTGFPAVDHKLWLRYSTFLPRLPEIVKTIKKLETVLAKLEQHLEGKN